MRTGSWLWINGQIWVTEMCVCVCFVLDWAQVYTCVSVHVLIWVYVSVPLCVCLHVVHIWGRMSTNSWTDSIATIHSECVRACGWVCVCVFLRTHAEWGWCWVRPTRVIVAACVRLTDQLSRWHFVHGRLREISVKTACFLGGFSLLFCKKQNIKWTR